MSIKAAKSVLRKEIKAKLSTLSQEEISKQSKLVFEKLLRNEVFIKSQRISVYLHMKNEIETTDIVKFLLENNKNCFIPKYTHGGNEMEMVPLYSLQDFLNLPFTKWNIKQPAPDDIRPDALATGGLDLIIAPGMAFTMEGLRLGHGRGYYDSYLRKCTAKSIKPHYVGLALKEQIVSHIPTDSQDVSLDEVLVA